MLRMSPQPGDQNTGVCNGPQGKAPRQGHVALEFKGFFFVVILVGHVGSFLEFGVDIFDLSVGLI